MKDIMEPLINDNLSVIWMFIHDNDLNQMLKK